ncbi:hypothetical protein [Suipraeoptans intestinalis]|uniref:hypothetical protein n=1 Tax=Suipraeoptans intestinalis TaxID=2606628 RepID=UPI001F1AFAC6|nr:hypothetical protein [Suipraeoptans intestinalis]
MAYPRIQRMAKQMEEIYEETKIRVFCIRNDFSGEDHGVGPDHRTGSYSAAKGQRAWAFFSPVICSGTGKRYFWMTSPAAGRGCFTSEDRYCKIKRTRFCKCHQRRIDAGRSSAEKNTGYRQKSVRCRQKTQATGRKVYDAGREHRLQAEKCMMQAENTDYRQKYKQKKTDRKKQIGEDR